LDFFKGFYTKPEKKLKFGLLRSLFFGKKTKNLGFYNPFLQPCAVCHRRTSCMRCRM